MTVTGNWNKACRRLHSLQRWGDKESLARFENLSCLLSNRAESRVSLPCLQRHTILQRQHFSLPLSLFLFPSSLSLLTLSLPLLFFLPSPTHRFSSFLLSRHCECNEPVNCRPVDSEPSLVPLINTATNLSVFILPFHPFFPFFPSLSTEVILHQNCLGTALVLIVG